MPDLVTDKDLVFVPGHKDLANVGDVEDFRAYLLDLQRLVLEARAAGLRGDQLARFVTPKLRAAHQDWLIGDRSGARNWLQGSGTGGNQAPPGTSEGLTAALVNLLFIGRPAEN